MIKSMTGYGKADVCLDTGKVTIEIRTLNGKTADVANFEYEVPAKYATTKGFSLLINIYDNKGKQYGLNNVVITGTVNGEKQQVARYTFAATANPAEGGTVSVNPNGTDRKSVV